ncbi:ferritin [Candidatus Micrarchaeota archaeon]|nr:ferritin [Candidatus Micrarchaeota archaeon]MBU1166316.1 ferritin [Candidatus Micrarchaeota archaeon]MBU1887048.1 ferritin [Candidatus Micrarchaeota archaeon]
MGKTAKQIVKNADKIIEELNRALADEWLAYIQYTLASKIVKAPVLPGELEIVAKDELEHANELVERIIQLGGNPIVDPKQFFEKTNCGYEVPVENAKKVLQAGLKGEACAIHIYKKIADMTKDSDPMTYRLILHIMAEEEGHEQKFEDIMAWLCGCECCE